MKQKHFSRSTSRYWFLDNVEKSESTSFHVAGCEPSTVTVHFLGLMEPHKVNEKYVGKSRNRHIGVSRFITCLANQCIFLFGTLDFSMFMVFYENIWTFSIIQWDEICYLQYACLLSHMFGLCSSLCKHTGKIFHCLWNICSPRCSLRDSELHFCPKMLLCFQTMEKE